MMGIIRALYFGMLLFDNWVKCGVFGVKYSGRICGKVVVLDGGKFEGVDFVGCKIMFLGLSGVVVKDVSFSGCSLMLSERVLMIGEFLKMIEEMKSE